MTGTIPGLPSLPRPYYSAYTASCRAPISRVVSRVGDTHTAFSHVFRVSSLLQLGQSVQQTISTVSEAVTGAVVEIETLSCLSVCLSVCPPFSQ
jgi:hypothetical protein